MKNLVILGCDHAGYSSKEYVKKWLFDNKYNVLDLGTTSATKKVDYPDIAKKVCKMVLKQKANGILICGSGTGMAMAANRIKGIRAALAYDKYSARMARHDNDANVLALRGRSFPKKELLPITKTWLSTKFSGLARHKKRVKKLG